MILGSNDGMYHYQKNNTGTFDLVSQLLTTPTYSMGFTPDLNTIVSAGKVYRLDNGIYVETQAIHTMHSKRSSVTTTPDGSIMFVGWDLDKGRVERYLFS